MTRPPHFDIDLKSFWRDPYPILAELRANHPVVYVPQLDGIVISRRDDIVHSEKNTAVFSSHQPAGLMNRLMGHNFMRKDGADHQKERKAIFPCVSPATARDHWQKIFQQHAGAQIDHIQSIQANNTGTATTDTDEFVSQFALPYSGNCLRSVTGLTNLSAATMDQVSQRMIDGIANYAGDATTEARCVEATETIDAAINELLNSSSTHTDSPKKDTHKGRDMLSVMRQAGMPIESIHANLKLAISGGQNEPRDAIAGAVWALLTHPDQMQLVRDGNATWRQVFEEFTRWISPIGMSPRRIAQPHTLNGIDLQPEDKVFFLFGSGNRDEDHFSNPERFDITRNNSKSIPFGAGPHFCAGAWISRAMIAEVALPTIFSRLPDLRLAPNAEVKIGGWAFRGVLKLPIVWN